MTSTATARRHRHMPGQITRGGLPLLRDAVYLTPLGRCCRWQPAGRGTAPSNESFVYTVPAPDLPGSCRVDAFTLSEANLYILRRVG